MLEFRTLAIYKPAPLNVFLSYGHDGFTPVSRYVRSVLQKRGHRVWFDEDCLPVGTNTGWDTRMEAGVVQAAAASHRGRVLFMMAHHGSKGFCVSELTKAVEKSAIIVVARLQV